MCIVKEIPEYTCLDARDEDDRAAQLASIQGMVIQMAKRWIHSLSPRERGQYDLDDILQEIWMRLSQQVHRYDSKVSLMTTWAHTIVRHELERIRGKARIVGPKQGPFLVPIYSIDHAEEEAAKAVTEIEDKRRNQSEEFDDNNETISILDQAIANLSGVRSASVVAWTYGINGGETLSVEEIARRLRETPRQIKNRRKKAIKEMRTYIERNSSVNSGV
jgi:RNA polymerase sigma factor (sigma-70 family)